MHLEQLVKDKARQLGFELAGITSPDPVEHYPAYQVWLQAGRHGDMRYLETERARNLRRDPRQVLPGCRSILVLGMCYPPPSSSGNLSQALDGQYGTGSSGLTGKVAAYAWGTDYHVVFPPLLREIVEFLQQQIGAKVASRWYTDTGPVLERELAQRAGLGWIGRNTCLIHPLLGSFFLLAEIFLDLELQPDPPFPHDRCGTCRRCVQACPTGCIMPDRAIDASRCVSYLTIELKSAIPVELRPAIGSWVFGCDICQQVCPWNKRFAGKPGNQREILFSDIASELEMTAGEFNRKFRPGKNSPSPILRAKRRGYLRNIAVALGNSRNSAAIFALSRALEGDAEPLVRGHAAWALGQIGGETARQVLSASADCELDPSVSQEIQAALRTRG